MLPISETSDVLIFIFESQHCHHQRAKKESIEGRRNFRRQPKQPFLSCYDAGDLDKVGRM